MSAEENKAVVRRWLEEVVSRGGLAVADELLAPNFFMYPPGSSEPLSREGFLQFLSMYRSGFPDMHDTIEDLIAEGDKVAVCVTIHGTHQGECQGIAPTGKQVKLMGFAIFRVAGGRITDLRALNDRLGLLQQLGVMPPLQ